VRSPRGVQTSVVKKSARAISPQWARRDVRQDDGRSGAGGIPWSFRTLATVLLATSWPRFFSAPLDPGVAPRGILGGHPHNQGRDLLHDPGTAWPLQLERPLPGDQLAVPPQDRVGRHQGGDLPQEPAPESSAFGGEAAALLVGQPEAAPVQLPVFRLNLSRPASG
jgi:hypothetical protein